MLLLFPRYNPEGILEYFQGDFTSPLWADGAGQSVLVAPFQQAEAEGGGKARLQWKTLGRDDFEEFLAKYVACFEAAERWVCALEEVFSPPKSVSVAALAGPRILPEIVAAHRNAVGFVAGLMAQLLVTRSKGKQAPIRARVLRFDHPFSRAEDPLLHTHLVWVPALEGGALHCYPWFFRQFALRQIYHFALASELVRAGFELVVTDAEELGWELYGVDDVVLKKFSKRAEQVEALAREGCQDSLSAALRLAALNSSRLLPKTEGFSLGEARNGWNRECGQSSCVPIRGPVRPASSLELPPLDALFDKSSAADLLTLQGRALALCLGQGCPVAEALESVAQLVYNEVHAGRLKMAKVGEGAAYLHLARYQQEKALLAAVVGGIGHGDEIALKVPSGTKVGATVAAALKSPNRVRIVTDEGGLADDAKVVWAKTVLLPPEDPPCLLRHDHWDADAILRGIPGKGDVLAVVDSPARHGDFLARLQVISLYAGLKAPDLRRRNFLKVCKGKGHTETEFHVEVRCGRAPRNPEKRWMQLENRRGAVCVVAPDYPEPVRRKMNMAMARRLIFSHEISEASELFAIDVVVPGGEAAPGMCVVIYKNHRQYHLGDRMKILEVGADGSLKLQKKIKKIEWSAQKRRKLEPHFAVVESVAMRVVPGMLLQAGKTFCQRRSEPVTVKEGEIVRVKWLDGDGNLVLECGRVIPARFRAFSPAFLVRSFARGPGKPSAILAEEPSRDEELRQWALSLRAKKLIVLSGEPDDFSMRLHAANHRDRVERGLRRVLRFVTGEGQFVPAFESWEQLLNKPNPPGNAGSGAPVASEPASVQEATAEPPAVEPEPVEPTVPPPHRPGKKKKEEEEEPAKKKAPAPEPDARAPMPAPVLPKKTVTKEKGDKEMEDSPGM